MAQLLFEDEHVENAVAVQMPIGIVAFVVPYDPQDKNSSDTVFLKVSVSLCDGPPAASSCNHCWLHACRTCSAEHPIV